MSRRPDSEAIRSRIRENAIEVTRLKQRIGETFRERDEGPAKRREWELACAAFHAAYDGLAFPGGWEGARERMDEGDADTLEAALCFLEVRPYFFRSGYMFDALLRSAKRVRLDDAQAARLQEVLQAQAEFREKRGAGSP